MTIGRVSSSMTEVLAVCVKVWLAWQQPPSCLWVAVCSVFGYIDYAEKHYTHPQNYLRLFLCVMGNSGPLHWSNAVKFELLRWLWYGTFHSDSRETLSRCVYNEQSVTHLSSFKSAVWSGAVKNVLYGGCKMLLQPKCIQSTFAAFNAAIKLLRVEVGMFHSWIKFSSKQIERGISDKLSLFHCINTKR